MLRILVTAAVLSASMVSGAFAQTDPIARNWTRPNGTVIKFQACGAAYCAIVQTGEHKGKQAGSMSGSGGKYRGTLTDLSENKTYKGKASLNGNSLKMSGCILGGLACKTEVWVGN